MSEAWSVTLWFQEKGGQRRWIELRGNEWMIGRVSDCDICIPKGNLSKRHQMLAVRSGKLILVDMKSTNGTYLDGRRISGPTVVKPDSRGYVSDYVWGIAKAPTRIADDTPKSAVWQDQAPDGTDDEHTVAFGEIDIDTVPDTLEPLAPIGPLLAKALLEPLLDRGHSVVGSVARSASVRAATPVFMGGDVGGAAMVGAINELAALGVAASCVEIDAVVASGASLQLLRRLLRSACTVARQAQRPIVAARAHVVPRGAVDEVALIATAHGHPRSEQPPALVAGAPVLVTRALGAHGAALLGADVASDIAVMPPMWALRAAPLHRDGGLRAACGALGDAQLFVDLDETRVQVHAEAAAFARAHGLDALGLPSAGFAFVLERAEGTKAAEVLRRFPAAHVVGRLAAL